MACPITQGGHNNRFTLSMLTTNKWAY